MREQSKKLVYLAICGQYHKVEASVATAITFVGETRRMYSRVYDGKFIALTTMHSCYHYKLLSMGIAQKLVVPLVHLIFLQLIIMKR